MSLYKKLDEEKLESLSNQRKYVEEVLKDSKTLADWEISEYHALFIKYSHDIAEQVSHIMMCEREGYYK